MTLNLQQKFVDLYMLEPYQLISLVQNAIPQDKLRLKTQILNNYSSYQ